MLWTIKGPTSDDMGIGHRTFGKRGPVREISSMAEKGVSAVMSGEWLDSVFMTQIALGHPCEGDSPGSMLTRAALVLLYAMLEAQLAVVAQWKMREMPRAFTETEVLFLNEAAVGVGHDGAVWLDSEQHPFKKRVKAIPAVLARCVDQVDSPVLPHVILLPDASSAMLPACLDPVGFESPFEDEAQSDAEGGRRRG
jgi:hypothetical protein